MCSVCGADPLVRLPGRRNQPRSNNTIQLKHKTTPVERYNPKMALKSIFLSLFPLFLAAQPATSPIPRKLDPARLEAIEQRMKSYVDRGIIAGAVTLVARDGVIGRISATGFRDLDAKSPIKADTIFQIMSMTKPVTGVALQILVEEGKVAISDPVEKYLPEFRGQWMVSTKSADGMTLKKPARPITIRDLMTHTSGLPTDFPKPVQDTRYQRTLTELVDIASQLPLEFEPGTKWTYSNTGLATLGRIIEVAADQPYEMFVQRRILDPLGMKDTHFFPPEEKYNRISMAYLLADGHLKKADVDYTRKGAKMPGPAGGLFSTAADLAKFYNMMLSGGALNGKRILSKASVDTMTHLHTDAIDPAGHGPGMGYGLTWTVVKDARGTTDLRAEGTYGHGGAFGTDAFVDPVRGVIGIFLIQRTSGGTSTERDTFRAMAEAAALD